jgi:hypothetical protein
MTNWKACGRKRSCPNFNVLSWHFLKGLRKTTKTLSQDSRSPSLDLTPWPPECEAGVLTTRPQRSVIQSNDVSRLWRWCLCAVLFVPLSWIWRILCSFCKRYYPHIFLLKQTNVESSQHVLLPPFTRCVWLGFLYYRYLLLLSFI